MAAIMNFVLDYGDSDDTLGVSYSKGVLGEYNRLWIIGNTERSGVFPN